jgi:hypothetical protein
VGLLKATSITISSNYFNQKSNFPENQSVNDALISPQKIQSIKQTELSILFDVGNAVFVPSNEKLINIDI